MRVDYLGLEAFVAIANYGSFQRAAEGLNLSQAALSHRLRKIEEDLGTALLTRSNREVSLTAAGQELLPEARKLLKGLQDVYESVRSGGRGKMRRFSFACLPTIATAILPEVLKGLQTDEPDLAFDLYDIPVPRIVEAVRSGAAEFGITIGSAEMSDIRFRHFADEEYRLFVHREAPLAARASVTMEDLEPVPMVRIASQSKNRQLLDMAFGQMRDRMRWQMEVQSAAVAMRMVSQAMVATILPATALFMAPASVVAIPFKGVRMQRSLGVVQRRGVPLSDGAQRLLDRIETAMQTGMHGHLKVTDTPRSRG
ncbi:LysR family transcriptional regulator [Sagittula salina]|uniref:LysR family transcriptional regulator n=1 Tax=Sagittula salina TaxID=2820268 RepID=A0A940MT29_9RHOB|nr:LysR family transcriptional regulator [Sagittula salina]MBP0484537.1 LysR family transcriptional regulator [Sagittula salina]